MLRVRWSSSCKRLPEPLPPCPWLCSDPINLRLSTPPADAYPNTDSHAPSTRRSGLVAGTGCIICSKTLFELKAVGISGVEETFQPQVFQPFVMFFGMLFALPMYLALEARKRIRARSDLALRAELDAAPPITVRHSRLPRASLGRPATAPNLARPGSRPACRRGARPDQRPASDLRCVTC